MEFDKTKVFTTFNCDEVKIGSKGYFANCKDDLIYCVTTEDKDCCRTLEGIVNDSDYPFNNGLDTYHYFYLVEEPKEKTKQPCTREELLEMLKKQGLPMLKCNLNGIDYMVEKIADGYCFVNDCGNYIYQELCENYTLLDGTELWVEE